MVAPVHDKKALRTFCKERRLSLTPKERQMANAAICAEIARHPAFYGADLILGFFPVRGEVDLTPLYRQVLSCGIPLAFPRCEGKNMTFHTVARLEDLRVDRFDIPAPRAVAPLAEISAKTLCLMPGLAAGKNGARLGYGGGFYDRFLATFKGITLFPVYECLLFDTLPTEDFDIPVTHIITEKGEVPRHA